MAPEARPARINAERLSIPGVIAMRGPAELSFSSVPHVLLGPDAGFPWCQPLDEWKHDEALVDARSLSPALRAAAGITLPEERLAEHEELNGLLVDAGADPIDDDDLSAFRVAARARLHAIDQHARRVLAEYGIAFWVGGYSRTCGVIWAQRVESPDPFGLWAFPSEAEFPGEPPSGVTRERFVELSRGRWADRVLRAMSGGVVSEPALLFAQHQFVLSNGVHLIEDEVAYAGLEAARRMAAGDEVVNLPLHGPVRRLRLPSFTLHAFEKDPSTVSVGETCPRRAVEVPAEDVYVRVDDMR